MKYVDRDGDQASERVELKIQIEREKEKERERRQTDKQIKQQ